MYESASVAVPLIVGWTRPNIVLPSGWKAWNPATLAAVLAHEAEHVRRRDSLTALVAGINRCLFWLHPLAWWIEHRLALLAEQACDQSCLGVVGDRVAYARLLLDMAGVVRATGSRVSSSALAMAQPSHIRRRIEAVLDESRTASRGLTRTGWAAVLLCGLPVVYGAGAIRLEPQPAIHPPPVRGFVREPVGQRPTTPGPLRIAAKGQVPPEQRPKPPARKQPPPGDARADGALVLIPVTVTDPLNRFVTGLEKENFRIFEDTVEQTVVQFFSCEETPLSVGLVFDTRDNVGDILPKVRRAAEQFLRFARPEYEFFLVRFGDRPELTVPFTSNRAEIESRLTLAGSKGNDALRDGFRIAIQGMKKARNPRKALLVVSGRSDHSTQFTEDELTNLVREAEIPVYAIGVVEPAREQPSGPSLLREVAVRTGGQHFQVVSHEDLPRIVARIAIELRNQYTLGYRSIKPQREGSFRSVQVELVQPRGLPPIRAHWGPGYYVSAR